VTPEEQLIHRLLRNESPPQEVQLWESWLKDADLDNIRSLGNSIRVYYYKLGQMHQKGKR